MYVCEMNLYIGHHNFVKFVEFLLSSGADINIKDSDGDTVLDIVKVYFPDKNPKKKIIINILENWPITMALVINKELKYPLDPNSLMDLAEFEGTRQPSGGKKRKSKKNNKKSKKNKRKSNKNN
jgi:hypothetical protein